MIAISTLSVLAGPALAAPDAPSTSRFGVGVTAAGESAVQAGLHLSGTAPAGPVRATVRVDHRAWRHPTPSEESFWEDAGVIDLPEHWRSRITTQLGARWTYAGPERLEPGAELSLAAGRWHTATAKVQDEYADLGATIWPLNEIRLGPELRLGGFGPDDWVQLVATGRLWMPVYAKLDGEGGRYIVDDRRFDPVETVNPLLEVGGAALGRLGPAFGQLEVGWQRWLDSEKNRELGQEPPEGGVSVEVVVGFGI